MGKALRRQDADENMVLPKPKNRNYKEEEAHQQKILRGQKNWG